MKTLIPQLMLEGDCARFSLREVSVFIHVKWFIWCIATITWHTKTIAALTIPPRPFIEKDT